MIFAQSTMKKFLYTPGMYFEIPEFQRPYSWETGNVREFLADLEECKNSKRNHYFGTVVQVEDTGHTYSNAIIDGQQRVTTSLLMIAAIYHLVKNNPALIDDPETSAEKIEFQYLVNKDLDNNRVKLRTVTTDNEILQRIFEVKGDESRLTTKQRQSNLYLVYSEFRKYFQGKTGLDKYIEALGYFEIASLTLVAGDDNPQRVFESINSTGKPLTDGDKIRNFALMLSDNEVRDHIYRQYWTMIEEALTDVNKDLITDFFRAYIISKRQAVVRLDAVYPEFKKLFGRQVGEGQDIEKINAFYSDIVESLNFYKALKLTATDELDAPYSAIAETIFKMRYLQIDLYIPFAMNVLRHHAASNLTDEELEEVFKLIETYFSRRIVSGIATTSVDRFMASLHRDILSHQKEAPDADYVDILRYVLLNRVGQTRIPDDTEYENAIRTREAYYQRSSFLIYVLTAAEASSKESVHTLHLISDGKLNLSIEHVMPQTLTNKQWQEMLGGENERVHREYLHTLANLTLTGYNSEYSNRPYLEKMHLEVRDKKTGETHKVGFADSKLPLNTWIAKQDTWNEETLRERQDWWVNGLKKAWPLPKTTFEPVEEDTSVNLLEATDLKGRSPRSVEVFGEKSSVTSWSEALDVITEAIFNRSPDFTEKIANDENLSRWIRKDASAFYSSTEIFDTGYYIDTGNDTNTKLRMIAALGKEFSLMTDDIKAELVPEKKIDDEA